MYKKMRLFLLVLGLISVLLLSACTNSVEFTINFDSNGGSEVSSIKTDGTSSITLPNDPIKDGYSFAGWYWDNSTFRDLFTVNSLLERGISGNLTVYAKWNEEDDTPIGAIEVTFNSMGGSEVNPQYVQKDNAIAIPNTSKVGYTLDGWYTSLNNGQTFDEKWSFTNNKVTTDITLYAKWIINQYTITFNSNGGSSVSSISQDYDTLVIAPANPTKLGYTFSGWSQPVPIIMPAEDVTLIAEWSINQYTITFNSNGGSPVTAITQDYETTVSKPTDPTKVGYTFAGWYSNSSLTTAYIFTTMPAEDITLYAKWNIITYSINYELDGGFTSGNPTAYTVDTNTITLTIPTKEGYTFDGWYLESEFITVKTQIIKGTVGNLTLYAKWIPNSYNINYYIPPDDYDPLKDIFLVPGETIIHVELNASHSAALTSSGRLFTWGYNYSGQLGDGTTTNRSTPTEITSQFILSTGDKIISVSSGSNHSAALTSSGRLFTWGSNNYGQLGDGTTVSKSTPTEITSQFILSTEDKIIQVSLGTSHSAALTSEGRLFTWGNNSYGQFGDGTTTYRSTTPTEITSQFILSTEDKIIQVSLGGYHSAALTSNGRLFTWGNNSYGHIGDGTTTDRSTPTEITSRFSLATGDKIISVSLDEYHSAGLTSSGRLFTWGYNGSGRLGDGTTTDKYTPTEITNRFSLATEDKIIQVSLGTFHSAALTSSGRLFTWGSNNYGQLGDGTTVSKSTPTEITSQFILSTEDKIIQVSLGTFHSAALTSSGRLFTWGSNNYGQLGDGTYGNESTTPTQITQAHYELLHSDTVIYNQSIMEYVPLRDGYTFSGWYSDSMLTTQYEFGFMPAEDITLYAKWVSND